MSGSEAMDEMERAGTRAVRRALRARREGITNAGSGQERSQDAGVGSRVSGFGLVGGRDLCQGWGGVRCRARVSGGSGGFCECARDSLLTIS